MAEKSFSAVNDFHEGPEDNISSPLILWDVLPSLDLDMGFKTKVFNIFTYSNALENKEINYHNSSLLVQSDM